MSITIRFYGNTTEVTETQKDPIHVLLRAPRKSRLFYTVRRPDSLRRTKNICMRRVSSALVEYGSPLLCTLTFGGSASDVLYASQALGRFQRRLRAKYPLAQSLFIPELSPRGRIHFHGLLFNVPLRLGDKGKGTASVSFGEERETRELAGMWGEGFVDVVQTDGAGRLANYIAKYITKGAGHAIFAPIRLVRVSNGFPKEIVVRDPYLVSKLLPALSVRTPEYEYVSHSVFLGTISKKRYTKNVTN